MTNNEPIEVSLQFKTQLLNSETIPQAQGQTQAHSLPHCIPHSANGHIILNFFKKGPVGLWGCGVGESNRILRYIKSQILKPASHTVVL
jgi:hypothetical protein